MDIPDQHPEAADSRSPEELASDLLALPLSGSCPQSPPRWTPALPGSAGPPWSPHFDRAQSPPQSLFSAQQPDWASSTHLLFPTPRPPQGEIPGPLTE